MTPIADEVLKRTPDFARQFRDATPFPHVAIKDFLDAAFCRQLLQDFPAFEDRHALNEMGQVGGKAVRMDVRDISEAYRQLDRYLQTDEFLEFVSAVTGIPDLLYDPDYIGGGTHENRHGQGLDAHVDFNYHPRTKWHRRLNLIVYLNEEWERSWGGELELHSDPWDAAANRTISMPPSMNTAVIFETNEVSWHGFSEIRLPDSHSHVSRKSFAIYLYTRERPADQTAPPHTTIYVPEMMPLDWQVGRIVDDKDLRGLRTRFSRLRTQLRFLYEREKHFGTQISQMEQAISEARASQRIELQGYATQPRGTTGLSPDGWVTEELVAAFVPTRKMKSLDLLLWAPPQIGTGQELHIKISGHNFVQMLNTGVRTPVSLPLRAGPGEEVVLRIQASRTWVPAADGSSGDQRALAYKLLAATIIH